MEVILKENVESLGKIGDVIRVKTGFARNYLIPRGLAVEADSRNVELLKAQRDSVRKKAEKRRKEAEGIKGVIESAVCRIQARAGEQGKLFGSVTGRDIEENMKAQGIAVDRKTIQFEEAIKSLGEFTVDVKLPSAVTARLKVIVVAEE